MINITNAIKRMVYHTNDLIRCINHSVCKVALIAVLRPCVLPNVMIYYLNPSTDIYSILIQHHILNSHIHIAYSANNLSTTLGEKLWTNQKIWTLKWGLVLRCLFICQSSEFYATAAGSATIQLKVIIAVMYIDSISMFSHRQNTETNLNYFSESTLWTEKKINCSPKKWL